MLNWPFAELHLSGLAKHVEYAQFLHDGSEVLAPQTLYGYHRSDNLPPDTLTLRLPVEKPKVTYPVIELFLKD